MKEMEDTANAGVDRRKAVVETSVLQTQLARSLRLKGRGFNWPLVNREHQGTEAEGNFTTLEAFRGAGRTDDAPPSRLDRLKMFRDVFRRVKIQSR